MVSKWMGLKLVVMVVLIMLLGFPVRGWAGENLDHVPGNTYRLVDQKGRVVSLTCREPARGDEIINARGDHYRVTGVEGKEARVEVVGQDQDFLALVQYYQELKSVPVVAQEWYRRPVGIYHTHSDESYVPTDGVSSIPFQGGIYQVGETFRQNLTKSKVRVEYDETPHDPHDANAYYRSRRTAMNILKQNPVAIFDVHRDGIDDPDFYGQIIDKVNATQLRLVVGRQNPKMEANLDFAKRLMAFANKQHPDLVKEIYMAKGNYNQDLLSTALLIEAGTYTNNKPHAESGVALLAQSVPVLLGLESPPAPKSATSPQAGGQGWKTALLLLLLVVLGGAGFLYLNDPRGEKWRQWLDRTKTAVYRRPRR